MKKLLSMILSIAMLLSLSIAAFATDNDGGFFAESDSSRVYISSYDCPSQYVAFANEKIVAFLEASEFSDLSPCYLGNPFTFANTDSNVYYFPVFYSGRISCILRVYSNEQGDIAGVLSKGFADELNATAKITSASDPLYIYLHGSDVIFKTANTENTVFTYPDTQWSYTRMNLAESASRTTVECSPENSTHISRPLDAQRSSPAPRYLDIFEANGLPAETQGDTNWCAAYAAAAIMRYKGINGLYAVDLMEYFYGNNPPPEEALSDDQVYTYATMQGFYTSKTNSTLSFAQLCHEINYDRPVYIVVRRQVGNEHKYHAIVLCGYDVTSAMMRIWNPWYDCYETIYSLYNYVPCYHQSRTYEYVRTIYNWA